jgi:hypothetical protein
LEEGTGEEQQSLIGQRPGRAVEIVNVNIAGDESEGGQFSGGAGGSIFERP